LIEGPSADLHLYIQRLERYRNYLENSADELSKQASLVPKSNDIKFWSQYGFSLNMEAAEMELIESEYRLKKLKKLGKKKKAIWIENHKAPVNYEKRLQKMTDAEVKEEIRTLSKELSEMRKNRNVL